MAVELLTSILRHFCLCGFDKELKKERKRDSSIVIAQTAQGALETRVKDLVAMCSTESTSEEFLVPQKFSRLRGRKRLFPFGIKCQS